MSDNNFTMNIIARLNKQLSKSAINSDLKSLDNSMYVKVVAKLSKTLTRKELNSQLKELNNLEAKIKANVKVDDKAKAQLENNIKSLQRTLSDIEVGLKANPSKINTEVDSIKDTVQKRVGKNPVSINFDLKKEKLISDIEYLGKRFSKLFSSDYASKKYEGILNKAYSVSDDQQLSTARAELQAFTAELKSNGLATESTADKWKNLISRSKDIVSAVTILRTVFLQVKQAVNTTIDLDKVYTDLVKVNDELTRNDYAEYLSQCNKKAQELATTQKGLIEGATEFSKSGYDLSTSDALSQKSTVLANVGDMSDSDSAKAIISGVQAYDVIDGYTDVVDKADALIDKYNEIGNTASITTSEIAQGVQSVGSVFADANTSVDEFISLLAAGNRQYQDADSLSLGLRTSALRIRGCTAELEAMGEETDTVVTSTAKLEEKIKGLTNINGSGGVEILEADGETFRSIYDIYVDIGKVYKEMSDTDQSALLELIAGKNRASAISATLNNMSEAQEILQNSLNSSGSAQKEYDAYLESTEAHLQQFQAKLVETYSSFMNGDMISHAADMGTSILDLVNKTDLLKHSLLAISTISIGKGITTIGASIATTAKQMDMLGNALQQVKSLPVDSVLRGNELSQLGIATQNLTENNLKLILSQKQLNDIDRMAILRKHNLTEEEAKAKLEKMGLTVATTAQSAANVTETATTNVLSGAMASLKASITGVGASIKAAFVNNPIGMGLMLVTTVASLATSAISKYNEKIEKAREAAEEAQNAIDDAQSTLKTMSETVSENKDRFLELSEGVSKFSKNLRLSEEDYAEYLSISNKFAELFPELIVGYDEQGNAILEIGNNAEETNQKINDLLDTQKEVAKQTLIDNMDKVATGIYYDVKEEKEEIESLKAGLKDLQDSYKEVKVDIAKSKGSILFSDDDEKHMKAMEEALTSAGIEFSKNTSAGLYETSLDLVSASPQQLQQAQAYYDAFLEMETRTYKASEAGLKKDIAEKEKNINSYYSKMTANLQAWAKDDYNYQYLSKFDGMQDIVDEMIPNIDWNSFKEPLVSAYDYQNYIEENIIKPLMNVPDKYKSEITSSFNKLLSFEQGDLSVVSFANDLQKRLDELGIEIDITPIIADEQESYDKLQNSIQDIAGTNEKDLSKLSDYTKGFYKEQAELWETATLGAQNATEAISRYEAELQSISEHTIDLSFISSQVTSLTSSYESLNTAISEQNETGTISSETLAGLQENYESISNAIEITSNGIILNTDKLSELNKTQKEAIESGFADAEKELTERFNENSAELAYYNGLLESNSGITEYNGQSLEELIATKQADQDATEGQINELRALQLEYGNVTGKHNAFIQALSSKDAGSMYDDVVSGLEQVQKEWDAGNYGKDEIRNFIDYMSYDDMSTASIEDIKNAYQSAMDEASKYFTETTKGQQNFLNLLKETKVNGEALASVDTDGNWTITIDDMDEAAKACGKSVDFLQDSLNKLKDKGFEIEFNTDETDLVDVQANLDAINTRIAEVKQQINSGDGSPKLKEELAELEDSKVEIEVAIDKQKAIEEIQSLQAQMADANPGVQAQLKQKQAEIANTYNIDLQSVLTMDTSSADSEVDGLTEKVDNLDLSTTIKVDANTNLAKSAIDLVTNKTYTAKINLEVNGTKFSSQLKSIIENAANKTGSTDGGTSNGASAYGTVNIKGNAHANGSIGISKKQKNVMVSEVKPEMVVDPRKGDYTIYQHPTMLKELPQNAIVFNGDQTEEILENGMTTSFGKSYVNGNVSGKAYKTGTTGSGNLNVPSNSTSSSTKSSSKKKSTDKTKSKTEIDWIARYLEQLQKKIDLTKAKFDNLFTVKAKSSNLDTQIKQTTKLMNAESKAADKYKKKADNYAKSSGLSKSLQKAVQDGRLSKYSLSELIKKYGEKTATKIQDYQKYWDNYQDALQQAEALETEIRELKKEQLQLYVDEADAQAELIDATNEVSNNYKEQNKNLDEKKKYIETSYQKQMEIAALTKDETEQKRLQKELEKELIELEKEKFDNIQSHYENQISLIEASEKHLQNQIDLLETKGMTINAKYYKAQAGYEQGRRTELEKSKKELEEQLAIFENAGLRGTENWYDAVTALNEVESEISDCNKSIVEMNNSITEVANTIHTKILDSISSVSEELDWIANLMSGVDMSDEDTGIFTKEGLATLGTYVSGMNAAKYAADVSKGLVEEMQKALDNNTFSFTYDGQEWIYNSKEQLEDAIVEANNTWKDEITNSFEYSSKIIDLMTDKLKNELSYLQKIIEARKENLQISKDLHDYQLSLQEKTTNISMLEKQIAAYSSDTSQEGLAKQQKLQAQLSKARDDLEQTEYERYISDQEDILDKLYKEYEELIEKETKNRDTLLQKGIDAVKLSADSIKSTIQEYETKNNYHDVLGNISNGIITMSGDYSALSKIQNEVMNSISPAGTIPTAIGSIKLSVENGLNNIANLIQQILNSNYTSTNSSNNSSGSITIDGQSHGMGYGQIGQQTISTISDSTVSLENKEPVALGVQSSSPSDKTVTDAVKNTTTTTSISSLLKTFKFPGFKKGGIVSVDDIEKQVKANGDSVIGSFNPDETILTPVQTEMFQKFINNGLPDLVSTTDMLQPLVTVPKMPEIEPIGNSSTNNIKATYNFTLENCTNADDIVKQIQQSSKVQKALRAVTTNQLANSGRLNVNKIR